jgi:hypothetical protein
MTSAKRKAPRLSDAQILAQIPGARQQEAIAAAVGLRATAVHYDAASQQVVLTLSTGYGLMFPASRVPGLAHATAAQRSAVTLSPSGDGVRWLALNTDASVPGLVEEALGKTAVAQALGRRGGMVTSRAKALAARANGAKGGRPAGRAGGR